MADIGYPVFQYGLVVWKYSTLIRYQIDLFRGIVAKGKTSRIVLKHELQRLFFIVFHDHFAGDNEVCGRLQSVFGLYEPASIF